MKKYILTIILACIYSGNFAQSPQGIPYQSALRNSSGSILANQSVTMRFTIIDSAINGTVVFQETHTANTNAQGIVSVNIGQGTPSTGTLAQVNWAKNYKFLQIEMDPTGGNTYTILGTQQMMSVPYALFSNTAGELQPKGSNSNTLIYTADGF
jgi:hypothetical protein